jgi:hypothetical protein
MSIWGEINRLLGDRKKTRRKRKEREEHHKHKANKRRTPRKKNGEFKKRKS